MGAIASATSWRDDDHAGTVRRRFSVESTARVFGIADLKAICRYARLEPHVGV